MDNTRKAKVLIIRFSSMGDIVHCFFALPFVLRLNSEIHWVTRSDFGELIESNPMVDKVWPLRRDGGMLGLLKLGLQLRKERFTHVYDAHSNVRSHILSFILKPIPFGFMGPKFVRRSKERLKRILLFKFKVDLYPLPQSMASTYIEPIQKWLSPGTEESFAKNKSVIQPLKPPKSMGPQLRELSADLANAILLVPSASAELKRWPVEHWTELIKLVPHQKFIVAGGPTDRFCEDLQKVAPERVTNISGQLNWSQSAWVASQVKCVVTNDTGLGHLSDYLGKRTFMFIGPVPFGYPHRETTKILELSLKCKPCSKHGFDPCKIRETKKCLVDIRPNTVSKYLMESL